MSFTLKAVTHGHFSTDKREHYKVKNNKINTLNYHFWDAERNCHVIMTSKHVNISTIKDFLWSKIVDPIGPRRPCRIVP